MFENKNFQSWFKENTPKEGLSETTTFSKQFVRDAWDNGYYVGYNKANEWNRVDEGKYPNKEQLGESFIVAFAFNEKTQEYYSFDCAEYIDKGKFCTHTNNDDNIIAWKEIVLPEGE